MDVKATVRVGKSGVTESVINEISAQLKNRKVVKIKFLKNTERGDMKEMANEIARRVNAEVEEVRGFTVTLRKR